MRCRHRRRYVALAATTLFVLVAVAAGLTAAAAVLHPKADSPTRVDAIVVVAGANDDRYDYALRLAATGVTDNVIVSRPPSDSVRLPKYGAMLGSLCSSSPRPYENGRMVSLECFAPDVDTTEGETTAATRIAHRRGWESLLVVTYWGHVSRVRIYFEQCFGGDVYVTDTPRPSSRSRKNALTHETGGYVKAFLKPAC